ncbi:MAG: hypothetical protein ACT4PI_18095 [Actinomycetota bacterium]
MALAALPRRDEQARARLAETGEIARPIAHAGERVLPVPGELGELIPALRRGSVVAVEGETGTGATSVALRLVAAATAAGEWAAAVELHGSLGGLAAAEAGIALERFAVARRVPPARWAAVVAALLDGIGLVLAEVPPYARAGDARRLAARARERGVVLVAVQTIGGGWPAEAALRVRTESSEWRGLARGTGLLSARELGVRVEGHGVPAHAVVPVARAG